MNTHTARVAPPARPTSYASALAAYQATGMEVGLIVDRTAGKRQLFVAPPARGVRSY